MVRGGDGALAGFPLSVSTTRASLSTLFHSFSNFIFRLELSSSSAVVADVFNKCVMTFVTTSLGVRVAIHSKHVVPGKELVKMGLRSSSYDLLVVLLLFLFLFLSRTSRGQTETSKLMRIKPRSMADTVCFDFFLGRSVLFKQKIPSQNTLKMLKSIMSFVLTF